MVICTVFDLKGGVDPTLQLWGFQALKPCSPASLLVCDGAKCMTLRTSIRSPSAAGIQFKLNVTNISRGNYNVICLHLSDMSHICQKKCLMGPAKVTFCFSAVYKPFHRALLAEFINQDNTRSKDSKHEKKCRGNNPLPAPLAEAL